MAELESARDSPTRHRLACPNPYHRLRLGPTPSQLPSQKSSCATRWSPASIPARIDGVRAGVYEARAHRRLTMFSGSQRVPAGASVCLYHIYAVAY
jgi:hypothetical protein